MKNSHQQTNIQAIACYENASEFIIQRLRPAKKEIQYLKIITLLSIRQQQLHQIKKTTEGRYSARFWDLRYVLMCEQCKRASSLQNMQIFEISSLRFISYIQQKKLEKKANIKQISEKIRDYAVLLKDGFYFSHQYNPTVTFPNQKIQGYAQKFTWNRSFFSELERNKISFQWKCPIIQGFVSSFQIFHLGVKIKYFLITRRSTQKGGTRYFDRGINDEGYVANFCQTEQVIKIDEFTFSDLQIRGSLPIFFQQVGRFTKTKVNRSFQLTHQAYTKHKTKIMNTYKRIFMVNLLSVGKRGEKLLTEQIESHVKLQNEPFLKYLYYDFHKVVKGNSFNKIDEMINKLRKMKVNLGYYVYDQKKEKVMSEQKGVFRTNCLDCLDRTNFFQAKLALITLEHIFNQLNISQSNLLDQMRGDKDNRFIREFRNIWADNGDAVSYHYTGTGSTHTDITRDGKRGWLGSFKHKYKSVTRFYNQNFWDFYKMKIVSALLGTKAQLDINEQLKKRQKQYKTFDKVDIFIMTWKAPKIVPKALNSFPKDAGIIVISIQDLGEQDRWVKRIQESLDVQQYILVQKQCVYRNMLRIYARRDLKSRISTVQQGKMKFSSYYNALISNKSANLIRFNIDNSKIVFVGCQLEKGREYVESRIKNIKEIHDYAFQIEQVGVKKSETIQYDDCIFLIGNMNTNIEAGFKNQLNKLSSAKTVDKDVDQTIQKMLDSDQFSHIRHALFQYRKYEQASIHFRPTYKLSNGIFDLDCSGWPDRIWYSGQGKVSCKDYNVIQQLRQQHVPVIGRYSCQICKIDKEKQQRVVKEIIEGNESKGQVGVGDQQQEDSTQVIQL